MPNINSFKKSGLIAAFFFLQLLLSSAFAAAQPDNSRENTASNLKIAAMAGNIQLLPVWSALLHTENGHYNIKDSDFLLSLPDFSLAKELKQTIDFLYMGEPSNVCRFPARYLWLKQQLDAPELPVDTCPDIIEFRQKVKFDEITLVFASERISQPASMLGHSFLKFSGKNKHGQDVSHAISFYTDADTFNLPKLLFDSLVTGKKGYFSLSPFYDQQQRYVDEEQRNLWEFQLTLDTFHKDLISLHILELKQYKLSYFFQKYNCATVINFLLALSDKPISTNELWVTPKDLIKHAQQAGLIKSTKVITPSRWLYRELASEVSENQQREIRQQVEHGTIADYLDHSGGERAYIQLELASAYNQYAYLNGDLNKSLWIANDSKLSTIKAQYFPEMSLSSDNRYSPLNTPGDSQISVSALHDKRGAGLAFTFLPISHTLSDDNRSYTSETSLQLFAATIKFQQNIPTLDRLTIFDMLSLVPYNAVTGGKSTHFRVAIEQQKNIDLEGKHVVAISGAIGLTNRIAQDIDIYSLIGAGIGHTGIRGYLYTTLEAGAIIREVWDSKSIISLTRTDNQIDMGSSYYTIAVTQSKYLDKYRSLIADFKRDINNIDAQNSFLITLKNVF